MVVVRNAQTVVVQMVAARNAQAVAFRNGPVAVDGEPVWEVDTALPEGDNIVAAVVLKTFQVVE